MSRLPEIEGTKPVKKLFKRYPIGYFHIDKRPRGELAALSVFTMSGSP